MGVIEITNLTKDYGNHKGVFNLSLSINRGEVFGFLGPNGAGKTTAIRHLMGFISPDKGICSINGLDCKKSSSTIHSNLGYIPGEISFMEDMKGMEFITFMAEYRGLKDLTRAKELIALFDLDPSSKIKKMSKGTKQKIGIICAFMHNPEILILDEPTSGLDPLMQNNFVQLIQREQEKGRTILMSSHIFEEIEKTCTRVGIIRQGELVTVSTIDNLKRTKIKKYLITLDSPENAKLFAKEFLHNPIINQCQVSVTIKDEIRPLIEAMHMHPVVSFESISQNLENIFMHYYGGDRND